MDSLICRFIAAAILPGVLVTSVCLAQEAKSPAASDVSAVAVKDPALLASIVEKLSPESRKAFGEMLAKDWKDRPEWAEMLIALLKGRDLGPGVGWFQGSQMKYDWSWLTGKLDANQDGLVSEDEMPKDAPYAEILFERLDRDNDGVLQKSDFDFSRQLPSTPPLMMAQFFSSYLDADSNGRITPEEIQAWLKRADKDEGGFATAEDLFKDFSKAFAELASGGGGDMPSPDQFLPMFFRGELGMWEAGPKLGEQAPDFTLPTHDGKETITLSKSGGKPVILIFGSFT